MWSRCSGASAIAPYESIADTSTGELRECDATHPKIGQVAELSTFAHQVSGTAVIVDDCTVRVDDFVFDGGGIDVRFYSGLGGNYLDGFSMSESDLASPAASNEGQSSPSVRRGVSAWPSR